MTIQEISKGLAKQVGGFVETSWADPSGEVIQFQDFDRVYIETYEGISGSRELCFEGSGEVENFSYEIPEDVSEESAMWAVDLWARYVKARRIRPPHPGTHSARKFGCRCGSSCGKMHNPDCVVLDHPNLPHVKDGLWKTGNGSRSVIFSNLGSIKTGKPDEVNGYVHVQLTTRHDPGRIEQIILKHYEADDLCQQFDLWQAVKQTGEAAREDTKRITGWSWVDGDVSLEVNFEQISGLLFNGKKVTVLPFGKVLDLTQEQVDSLKTAHIKWGRQQAEPLDGFTDAHGNLIMFQNCTSVWIIDEGSVNSALIIEGDQPAEYLIPQEVELDKARQVVAAFKRFKATCVDPDPHGAISQPNQVESTLGDILADLAHRLMEQNTETSTIGKALTELVSLLKPPERLDPYSVPIPEVSYVVGREATLTERHSWLAGLFYMAHRVMSNSNSQSVVDFVREQLYKIYDDMQVPTVKCGKCHVRIPCERAMATESGKVIGLDCLCGADK